MYISTEDDTCQNKRKYWTRQNYSHPNRQGVTSQATGTAEMTGAAMTSIRVMLFAYCMLYVIWCYT